MLNELKHLPASLRGDSSVIASASQGDNGGRPVILNNPTAPKHSPYWKKPNDSVLGIARKDR
jgi:hypothetical protein